MSRCAPPLSPSPVANPRSGSRALLLAAGLLGTFACSASSASNDAGSVAGDAGDAGPASDGGADGGPPSRAPGAACQADSACDSQVCGSAGGDAGHCCSAPCAGDGGVCGAVGCDDTGACRYPDPSTACGSSCAGGVWTRRSCDGRGGCAAELTVHCPGALACTADGVGCQLNCSAAADCLPGYHCRDGLCIPQQPAGSCDQDADCASGLCLGGSCCASACGRDPDCGARSCTLDGGACVYPDPATACGPTALRSCAGATLTSAFCDGAGVCGSSGAQVCHQGFGCNTAARACYASCDLDGGGCAPGFICAGAGCCPALLPGGTLSVDDAAGDDSLCCGTAAAPCRTLTQALSLIDRSRALGVTVQVRPSAANLSWGGKASLEQWPVHLGWGVTVTNVANPAFFAPAGGEVFQVYAYAGEPGDAGVRLLGSSDLLPLVIGYDRTGAPASTVAVRDGPRTPSAAALGLPLSLGDVVLSASDVALVAGAGAAITLGPQAVAISPTPQLNPRSPFFILQVVGQHFPRLAVQCAGGPGLPAALREDPQLGFATLDTADDAVLDIGDDCQVSLNATQVGQCPLNGPIREPVGLRLHGSGAASLGAATQLRCFGQFGIELTAGSAAGGPSALLSGAAVSDCGCAGALVAAGALTSNGAAFSHSHFGVVLVDGGTLALQAGASFAADAAGASAAGQVDLSGAGCAGSAVPSSTAGSALLDLANARVAVGPSHFDSNAQWSCSDPALGHCSCAAAAGAPSGCPATGTPPGPFGDGASTVGLGSSSFDIDGGTFE